ncbi:thaumatin family protein, partial [Streptomyces fildesensis]|uniref:thaumatin family protein n=1 Tax=Streptomyces fildesensis TaxID=375757 RepID=UPI0027B8FC94
MWARTGCSTFAGGRFSCVTGDCGDAVACNGSGGATPATLVEVMLNVTQDYYDISLVDGFNLPVSVSPQGGSGANCTQSSCAANVNSVCPSELTVKGTDGSVAACKSACTAFLLPQYCCTDAFSTPTNCKATNYSSIFKNDCPQAYS